jgi:hypothetical protein
MNEVYIGIGNRKYRNFYLFTTLFLGNHIALYTDLYTKVQCTDSMVL